MAEIKPFRGLHYSFQSNLSNLIAPPYDVISKNKREELLKRDPLNSIRIILGDPSTLTEKELSDLARYEQAAKTFKEWVQKGFLLQDPQPSIYILQDRFHWRGSHLLRLGLLLTVRLEELGKGKILPHERTLSSPIQDRYRLMKSTLIQESPIYLTFKDEDRAVRNLISSQLGNKPVATFKNLDEPIEHSLFQIDSPSMIQQFSGILLPKPFLIADGHHRYSTALHFMRNEGKSLENAKYVMAFIAPTPDPGVVLSAIHRIFYGSLDSKSVLEKSKPDFDNKEEKISWDSFEKSGAPFALLLPSKMHLLFPKKGDSQQIPSLLLNDLIVKKILNLDLNKPEDQKKVRYVKQAEEMMTVLQENPGVGFWLKPLTPSQVIDIAEKGEILPQKSTFFYPKVMSGLLFNKLN